MNKHYSHDDWSSSSPHESERAERWASRGLVVIALFVLCSWACGAYGSVAPTCSLTTTSQTVKAISPATLALAFNSTNAATCTATSSGNQTAWTGSKALSGTQTLTGIKQSADYTYTCAATPLSVGTVLLSWTAPTQNSDGSSLTDLKSYRAYWGTTSGGVMANKVDITDPSLLVYTLDSLPPGLTYFALSAINAAGIESKLSNIASKTVTVPAPLTCSQTVHIDVVTQPNPPTIVTVDTVAYTINKSTDALQLAAVGTVPLGVTCKPQYDANGLNVVPRDQVKFKSSTRPLVVVAKCG